MGNALGFNVHEADLVYAKNYSRLHIGKELCRETASFPCTAHYRIIPYWHHAIQWKINETSHENFEFLNEKNKKLSLNLQDVIQTKNLEDVIEVNDRVEEARDYSNQHHLRHNFERTTFYFFYLRSGFVER